MYHGFIIAGSKQLPAVTGNKVDGSCEDKIKHMFKKKGTFKKQPLERDVADELLSMSFFQCYEQHQLIKLHYHVAETETPEQIKQNLFA